MDYRRRYTVIGLVALAIILVLVVTAPLMAPYGSFTGLDGKPGVIDGGWDGHGIAGAFYALGDLFCHQEQARSLIVNGSQMPLCVRDVGILCGLVIGFLACVPLGHRLGDGRYPVLGLALIAVMVVEWAVETTGFDSQTLRMLTGISAGFGASLILVWMLYRNRGWDAGERY